MGTACSSSRQGVGPDPTQFPPWVWVWIWSTSISPLGMGLDLIPLNFPLRYGPGPDSPQFPPWVWAWIWSPQFPPWLWLWTWSPSISPLGVGPDLIPFNFTLGCRPGGPPRTRHSPQEQTPQTRQPPRADPPPRDLLKGMLGYHLQCTLG